MITTLILSNPRSGQGRGPKLAHDLDARLSQAPDVHHLGCQSLDQPLPQEPLNLIVYGGDGSLHHLLKTLPPGSALLPVPVGTANLVAAELKSPCDPESLLRRLRAQQRLSLPYLAGDVEPIHHASFGFEARVVGLMHQRRQGPITRWHYLPCIAQALSHRPSPCRIWVDGNDWGVFMGGVMTWGQHFVDKRLRLPLEGKRWQVLLWRHWTPLTPLKHLYQGYTGHWKDCWQGSFQTLRWEGCDPVPWQCDGEWAGSHTQGSLRVDGSRTFNLLT